jgi:hypothetical protein
MGMRRIPYFLTGKINPGPLRCMSYSQMHCGQSAPTGLAMHQDLERLVRIS